MGNPLKSIGEWLARAMTNELKKPLEETKEEVATLAKSLAELSQKVEEKHADDPIAQECDLAVLDDRICYMIDKARERGYTTAGERRRVGRMHDAYRSRGGNHGEELEYERYCRLPTEEEWKRNN